MQLQEAATAQVAVVVSHPDNEETTHRASLTPEPLPKSPLIQIVNVSGALVIIIFIVVLLFI